MIMTSSNKEDTLHDIVSKIQLPEKQSEDTNTCTIPRIFGFRVNPVRLTIQTKKNH